MFSLEAFYSILQENLLNQINVRSCYFSKFGSTDAGDIKYVNSCGSKYDQYRKNHHFLQQVLFYDQEPIYTSDFLKLYQNCPVENSMALEYFETRCSGACSYFGTAYQNFEFQLFANSEKSQEKNDLLETFELLNWYYFFHGFAALHWYRNFRYFPPIRDYSKTFITFNNLFTQKRSYRLNLISRIYDLNGYISLGQYNTQEQIKQEIFSNNSLLSKESRSLILKNLYYNDLSQFVIDTDEHHGALSAGGDYYDFVTLSQGLFHIVTETVFYDEKLHLTEKIFKPIAARRPFFLVAAPGNLAYLKTYGFQTFDRWIDESYDEETDPDLRIIKISNEIRRLCSLSEHELDRIYQEMQPVLEHNFSWFYGGFRQKIVDELVDNFRRCLIQYNAGRSPRWLEFNHIDFEAVKKLLAQ